MTSMSFVVSSPLDFVAGLAEPIHGRPQDQMQVGFMTCGSPVTAHHGHNTVTARSQHGQVLLLHSGPQAQMQVR